MTDSPVIALRPGDTSSWRPVPLGPILAGQDTEPVPTVLARDDGPRLFYPGKMHSVAGEPESLKSWLCLVAAAQELDSGRQVGWIDFEDSPSSVVGRLLALGCAPALITGAFHYVRPSEALDDDGRRALADLLALRPSLIVLDGATEALGLHGFDGNSNGDVARFFAMLPRQLAARGPAVVIVDHVIKNREGQGRWAVGAGHKLAALDGAAFTVDLIRPFGRGKDGAARIKVAKDRPGRVREHAAGPVIAELHLSSQPGGAVTYSLQAPSSSAGPFRPTNLMQKISQFLEASPSGASLRAVQSGVSGKTDAKRTALDLLVTENYASREAHGQSHLHRSLRPFREGQDQ